MPRVDAEKMGRVGTYPLQIALYSGLDGKLSVVPVHRYSASAIALKLQVRRASNADAASRKP